MSRAKDPKILDKQAQAAWLLFRNLISDHMGKYSLKKYEICEMANITPTTLGAYYNNLNKLMEADRKVLANLLHVIDATDQEAGQIMMACESVHMIARVHARAKGGAA